MQAETRVFADKVVKRHHRRKTFERELAVYIELKKRRELKVAPALFSYDESSLTLTLAPAGEPLTKRREKLSAKQTRKLGEALKRLHAAGFEHGDLSADNILVDSEGKVKLIDFGNSRASGSGAAHEFSHLGRKGIWEKLASPERGRLAC